jgi:hypothetical protein
MTAGSLNVSRFNEAMRSISAAIILLSASTAVAHTAKPRGNSGLSPVIAKFARWFTEPMTESTAELRRVNIPEPPCDCLDGHPRSEQVPYSHFLAGIVEKPLIGQPPPA